MLGFSPLASAPLGAFEEAESSTDGFRITEASDSRILENGDTRVTEGFTAQTLVGEASLSAQGSLVASASIIQVGASSLNAVGSITSSADKTQVGSSSLTATGSISADADLIAFGSSSYIEHNKLQLVCQLQEVKFQQGSLLNQLPQV
jgi:hypothetical protein